MCRRKSSYEVFDRTKPSGHKSRVLTEKSEKNARYYFCKSNDSFDVFTPNDAKI